MCSRGQDANVFSGISTSVSRSISLDRAETFYRNHNAKLPVGTKEGYSAVTPKVQNTTL